MIEEWWQEKPFEGSYICPFQKALFQSHPHARHAKHTVMATHDVVVDLSETLTG
ncbi:hypothetical protein Ngar_c21790 [Candidatus Nitrososphaera gargensis Ga9.2]|uniref:Uncharacterized protein n=1 Tax=Nitrososphaera gargensis (strain Ga9.2) TaxID=1237085 RepID=K0INC0_NITGG|nr:hypothetical protein Ngar_c21790 [Candidatus Nitrososphaera gargensis Ga9.2]